MQGGAYFIENGGIVDSGRDPVFLTDGDLKWSPLRGAVPHFLDHPNPKVVFLALRALRNNWYLGDLRALLALNPN